MGPVIGYGIDAPFYLDLEGLAPVALADAVSDSGESGVGSQGGKTHCVPYRPFFLEEEGLEKF
jgi:hypothetical protein